MARRPSKHLRPARPLSSGAFARLENHPDGQWLVQTMPAANATKVYLCPGCQLDIGVGQTHLVCWPRIPAIGQTSAVESRRHWHPSCWQRRSV